MVIDPLTIVRFSKIDSFFKKESQISNANFSRSKNGLDLRSNFIVKRLKLKKVELPVYKVY